VAGEKTDVPDRDRMKIQGEKDYVPDKTVWKW
jgi:hypothetical protein